MLEAEFVDQLPAEPLAPDALQKLMAKLLETPVEAPPPVVNATLAGVPLPAALVGSARIGALRRLGPGSWFAPIWNSRTAQDCGIYILRAPPGQQLPRLQHTGPELICVLLGAFDDEQRYQAGDFVEIPDSSKRSLTVTADGACACLIAQRRSANDHSWPSYRDGDARRSAALRARPN
jgi:anti-sigma factor ChrR (cupin superfamily)